MAGKTGDKNIILGLQKDLDIMVKNHFGEVVGGRITPYTEHENLDGAETHIFLRDGDYTSGDKAPNAYDKAAQKDNSGETKSFEVGPLPLYAFTRVPYDKIVSSSKNTTKGFMKGLLNAMEVAKDVRIVKCIEAGANTVKTGDPAAILSTDAQLLALKQAALLATANAGSSLQTEAPQRVAMLISTGDYAKAFAKTTGEGASLSSEDFKIVTGKNGNLIQTIYGCEVVRFRTFKTAALRTHYGRDGVINPGQIILLPQGAVGSVSWNSFTRSKVQHLELAEDKVVFWGATSFNCILLEEDEIIIFSSKK